ncbi:putative lipoprotein, RlpA family [Myxococcus xanthus DK 1622]|uniref:Probable endolytic peptidoglycan transglycosylase RlpA n=1 Tax=Myxococcus xanthus (strain DK1622) TaxID=246197 RepID=Q1D996_MYXXD|nr:MULTISPECIES: septal ring lytic transglycosylase RlpA family protein [Myxococcus]ABF87465.1 putative lipoprotein, RlpA family [Myxococcus xanthus DK 1622]NOJ54154.1 septal ring lytic transglycosylase RlpA family protein [Myxococcus xanthus]QPM82067.1 septal ring lytic transglycosylase RlpA family protein [Myxococcus xanthus]QVW71316.1 septal ring lytic transglycosylase RlpA family protein [Myxococcus xanthus DZ2]QZZ50284.1 Endolytic peptidoglycan transglycosylase RlpA [Myxococcus xanthus]
MRGIAVAGLLCFGFTSACASRAARPDPVEEPVRPSKSPKSRSGTPGVARREQMPRSYLGEGLASFYGPGLHGRPTASGERFDQEAMTAAHRKLRFGSCLRVVNMENGRAVKVRVNDRGPFIDGRIVDLSKGAARKLDMLDKGVVRVRLYRCADRVSEIPQEMWAAPV